MIKNNLLDKTTKRLPQIQSNKLHIEVGKQSMYPWSTRQNNTIQQWVAKNGESKNRSSEYIRELINQHDRTKQLTHEFTKVDLGRAISYGFAQADSIRSLKQWVNFLSTHTVQR